MHVVNVNLVLDDEIYDGVMSGVYELCGMAKNMDNQRVVKHLPTVIDSAKEGAVKAVDMMRANKTVFVIALAVAATGGAIYGAVTHRKNKAKKALQSTFAENMKTYLDAARNGTLNAGILLSFIASIEELSIPEKKIDPNIPLSQIHELISSISDYTIQLAVANGKNTETIKNPSALNKDDFSNLTYYLEVQKNIIMTAA